jgi:hypothetical protein
MLGSNPSADSVASTDPNGDAVASPFHSLLLAEAHRDRHQSAKSWGAWGQSPRKDLPGAENFPLSWAPSHNACFAPVLAN